MMMRKLSWAAVAALTIALGSPCAAVAESTAPLPQSVVRSLGDASDPAFTGTGSASIDAIMKGLYSQFASGLLLKQGGVSVGPAAPLYTTDANNAAYQGVVALSSGGSAVAPLRSIGYICTASGSLAVVFPDSSTLTLPVTAGAGFQTLPFAVTQITLSGGAACNVWSLK